MSTRQRDAGLSVGPETGSQELSEILRKEIAIRWEDGAVTGDRLPEILSHALLPAGKLLRPLLFLDSVRAVGGSPDELVTTAVGIEYLHVGSLVHDDVIDGDETRRGRPSVIAEYGLPDAIVAGDALILGLFHAVADCASQAVPAESVVEAVQVLARAGMDLCRGQSLEVLLVGDLDCGMERYLTMATLKTGALFRGACQSGAILGGGTPAQSQALARYGEHLGLAFQMQDDNLAYTGDSVVTGKTGECEIANRRPTFPVLVGHEIASPEHRSRIELALSGTLPVPEAYQLMREALDAAGALPMARQRALREVALAQQALLDLPAGASRTSLASVAELAVNRER